VANVLFLHGLDARPGGVKPTYLSAQGHVVYNPALPRDDFVQSVRIAQEALAAHPVDVIVGSSRGGAVTLAMDVGPIPVLAIAPAWRFFLDQRTDDPLDNEKAWQLPTRLRILHSPADDLIPIDHSRQLLSLASPEADIELIEVGLSHAMTDAEALATLDRLIRQFTPPHSPQTRVP
jgi:hypothetical protein